MPASIYFYYIQLDPFEHAGALQTLYERVYSDGFLLAGVHIAEDDGTVHKLFLADDDDMLHATRFGVTKLGQVAGIAALGDQDHLKSVVKRVATARDEIAAIARNNGLTPLASATNFVAIDCGRDGDYAKRVLDALVAAGVFVRMPGVAPLNRCIRVTAGTVDDLRIFAEELPRALAKAQV